MDGWRGKGREKKNILHPPTAARPVAVVEVDAFALQDEGADAVLGGYQVSQIITRAFSRNAKSESFFRRTWDLATVRSAVRGIFA
jgi:hypothetical protein